MDASQRWETEALRSGSPYRKTPPLPSAKQEAPETESHDPDANWVTLREAETATGIPVNTLRKWSRKSAIPSYLESDGELSLRMVDLDAVIEHAHKLGRTITPVADDQDDTDDQDDQDDSEDEQRKEAVMVPEGSLIVPLDAWNKMLNQLGNLHEAGQDLAEARERAAKAETEATFLRERLAELREQNTEQRTQNTELRAENAEEEDAILEEQDDEEQDSAETTSYWRYLTFGWRDRKKR